MLKKFKFNLRSKSKGSALLIAIFLGIIAAFTTVSMMTFSVSNTKQIANDSNGKIAFYAAESGLAAVNNYFNLDFNTNWETTLEDSDLPTESSPETLSNGATYWVDSISYIDSNEAALIDIVGNYKNAYRKIRVKIKTKIPDYFDNYGLLTDGILGINGKKTLNMSVHANDGLDFKGTTTLGDDVVASQSSDPDEDEPDPDSNPVGGYVEPLDVPMVPIDELRTQTQEGLVLDIEQADLNTQIADAAEGSLIYIGGDIEENPDLTLSGNMNGKIIFVDGDVNLNVDGSENLSNLMLISSGGLSINGSIDIGTSHEGKIDVVLACNDDITLNGSRDFQVLFWTNGSFTQNGSSVSGRVIAHNNINLNGNFTLTSSNELYEYEVIDKVTYVSTWQQVSMDN